MDVDAPDDQVDVDVDGAIVVEDVSMDFDEHYTMEDVVMVQAEDVMQEN
jgi:ribosomal protein L21